MKDSNLLGKIFLFWRDVARKYEKIKNNPEKSENDVSLGVTSLSMSIVGTVMTVAFAYFTFKCLTSPGNAGVSTVAEGFVGIILIVCGVICAVIAAASFVFAVLASILYAQYQRKLNNNIIGIIALIVSLLLSVGTIVAVIVLATQIFAL